MKKATIWYKEYTGEELTDDNIELFMTQYAMDVLEEYTQFLLKNGYADADVYCEPPTAIDRFMHPKLNKL